MRPRDIWAWKEFIAMLDKEGWMLVRKPDENLLKGRARKPGPLTEEEKKG